MSKKREFPILNGKLISDLDANGFKILGADIEVPAEKIKEAVAPELDAKADKTALEAEAQRATGVEATLGNAIATETQRAQEAEAALRGAVDGKADKVANATSGNLASLDENGNLVDSGMTLRDFAVAKSLAPAFVYGYAYEVGDLCTSFDNDEYHRGTWLYKCILATDGSQLTMPEIDSTHWALATVEDVLAALREAVAKKVDVVEGKGLSTNDYTNEDKAKLGTAYTPDNPPPAPDMSGYATKDAALPRYYFTILEVVNGVVTVPPYTYAGVSSDGTAFTVAFGGNGNGYMRDCILIVECGDVAPTITWPAYVHPRTDAETDFACVAGTMNVYWISEYVEGEFVVAGWQQTAGGSAV